MTNASPQTDKIVHESEIKEQLQKIRVLLGNKTFPDQRSTQEQLQDLLWIANQLGLYDAADAIQRIIK